MLWSSLGYPKIIQVITPFVIEGHGSTVVQFLERFINIPTLASRLQQHHWAQHGSRWHCDLPLAPFSPTNDGGDGLWQVSHMDDIMGILCFFFSVWPKWGSIVDMNDQWWIKVNPHSYPLESPTFKSTAQWIYLGITTVFKMGIYHLVI